MIERTKYASKIILGTAEVISLGLAFGGNSDYVEKNS